ncbi:MAG: RagB/SusD family nutrient uptake outer membrane protein [Paludibacter sp.]|nr:RagB/SusD family nutrient uptake outer membrane protein [Paludibacter sp.]
MKKYIGLLLAVFIASLLTSCSDWLTLAPEDGVTRQEFWQTKEQVNSAVIGCYASLLDGPVEKMFLWGELRGDMLTNGVLPNYNYTQVLDGEISSANSVVDWGPLYTTINNCNTVLKFAPTVSAIDGTFTEKQLKEYEAEALTIRAMMYFYLVRAFRDVPLVLQASVSDNQNFSIPKTSGAIILDSLVRDLKIASMNAPISYPTIEENKSRITSWAAKTLLADIYLWQENYAACNNLCQEIIGSGKFSLIPVEKLPVEISDGGVIIDTVTVANESDADKMFIESYVKGNSIESIFEIPFTSLKTNPFYSLLGPDVNKLAPKADIVDAIIFPPALYMSAPDATDIRGSGCSYRAGVVWKYVGTSRTGAVRSSIEYTTPWIVYKYSDVLLMKAEALNQIGLQTHDESAQIPYGQAASLMEQVRVARNAVNTSDYKFTALDIDGKNLERAILDERAREFAYEGKRWFDVLRYAKRGDYDGSNIQYLVRLAINSAPPEKQTSLIAKYKDPKHNSHYWPIYYKELEVNKELKQNDFYAQ